MGQPTTLTIILYAGVVLVCTWLAASMEKRPARLKLFFCILIAALVAGLRAKTVGNDTAGYFRMFESYGVSEFVREPAFLLYIKVFMGITGSAQACIFITAFVTNGLMIGGIWKMRQYAGFGRMVFAYMCIPFFLTMSGIRQWLSIAIVCYGLHYIFSREYLKYLFFLVIATLFHYSSIVAFAFLGISILLSNTGKLNTLKVLKIMLTLVVCGAALVAGYLLINSEYQTYLNALKYASNAGLMSMYRFLVFLLYVATAIISKRKDTSLPVSGDRGKADNTADMEKTVGILAATGFLIWTVSAYASQYLLNVGRIGWVFLISEGLLYAQLAKKRTNLHRIGKYAMVVMFLYTLYATIYMDGNYMVPYKFFWMS